MDDYVNPRVVDWQPLGTGYPPADANAATDVEVDVARSTFDVLAPVVVPKVGAAYRSPVFEMGHEETPTVEEVQAICVKIAKAAMRDFDASRLAERQHE